MSLLRAILSLDEPFRGLGPMLNSKRAMFKGSFYGGLATFLLLGLLIGVMGDARNSSEAPLAVLVLWTTFAGFAAFLLPIVGSAYLTTGRSMTPAGGRCRREEMLTLPIGRLVIPSQILLVSLGSLAAWLLGSLIGTGLTFGPSLVWAAVTSDKLLLGLTYAVPVLLVLLTASNAFTSVGNNNAFLGLGWILIPASILPALPGMGYNGDVAAFLWLWGMPLSAFYLLVPFALYALPTHHWSDVKLSQHPHHVLAQVLVYPLLVVLVVLGWTALALGLLLAGGAVFCLARRQVPREHRASSGLAVTLGLGLAFCLPPLAVCLAVDAWVLATPITQDKSVVARSVPSPDGKRIALEVKPLPGDCDALNDLTMVRVAIVDPTGATPPKKLSPRFGRIAGWSKDGRYLAFHDETFGRFSNSYDEPDPSKLHPRERILLALTPSCARTWIYDTTTDQVVAKLPRRIVRPGWTTPEELIHLSVSVRDAQLHLEDGTGRAIAVDTQERQARVLRYEPEGPVLSRSRRSGYRTYPFVIGLGPAEWAPQRWTPTGLVDVDTTTRWKMAPLIDAIEKKRLKAERLARQAAKAKIAAELAELDDAQARKRPKREHKAKNKRRTIRAYRLTRGEEVVDVRGVFTLLKDSWTDEGILASAPEGIVRIALPSGTRTLLLPAVSATRSLPLRRLWGQWLSEQKDRTVLIDVGTTDTVAVPPNRLLEAILPGRVLLTRTTTQPCRATLTTPAGEQRALLPH